MKIFESPPTLHFLPFLLAAAMLAGCAGQRLQREGMNLLNEGRYEEGLAKLADASKAEPGNFSYRTAYIRNREQIVNKLLLQANAERSTEHADTARVLYERALKIAPDSNAAKNGLALLDMEHRHGPLLADAEAALKRQELDAAEAVVKRVLIENPGNGRALVLQRQIEEQAAKALSATPGLKAKFRKPVTLQFRDANLKMVFEALSRTSGINVLLDKDTKADTKITIFVKDVSVEDAVDLIMLQSQLEKKVISDNTLFIYPNTQAKLKEYQDLKIRSFHLTNADPKQILTMLKTLLRTKDIFVHEKTNSIVMRDTPEAIALAEKLIADQDMADPEVMLEVEVLEISGSRLSEIGLQYPGQVTFSTQGVAQDSALTLDALRGVNSRNILVSPAPAITLNLLLQDGESNLLASPRIRARNHEKAKIMIGDRVPVITNAVTPVSTGTPVITGSVQYLDVGLKLEVEPEVHLDNEVGIKVNLEVSSIVKEVQNLVSGTLAYQVGTRNASTVLRLKDGETQILAGLISDEDRSSASKVPGLGQLPVLGRLFSSNRDDNRKTEIVLSITPRIVSNSRLADARKAEYWSGTELSLRSNPMMLRPLGTVAASASGSMAGTAARAASLTPPPRAAGAGVVSPAAQPVVLSWQGPSQAKVGETISMTVNTQSAQRVNGLGLLVGFDPALLKPLEVLEGDFLKQGKTPPVFSKEVDQAGGRIRLDLAGGGDGASGAGSLATIVFEVLAAGQQARITAGEVSSRGVDGEALAFIAPEPHAIEVVK